MEIRYPHSVRLANLPTPIEEIKLPAEHGIPQRIFIKRDDLTGCELSGNKVRKLEFCIAEALAQGADTLITCGGVQSNHARATSVAAARLGLKCVLILRGEEPNESDGNILIERLAGAQTRFIANSEWPYVESQMKAVVEEIASSGHRGYIIPEGASYPPGVFGYIKAAREIVEQEKELGVRFDHVVFAVGSGGTYAGLAYGARIYGLSARIVGVNVLETPEYFAKRIARLSEDFIDSYGSMYGGEMWFKPIEESEIEIAGGHEGPAYAVPTDEGIALIKSFARSNGIYLDPTYTGKAMLGLLGEARAGRFGSLDNILFVHTGGIFSLFPWKRKLAE